MAMSSAAAEFLTGPAWTFMGTGDAEGTPCIHRVFGLRADEQHDHIIACVPEPFVGPLLANVQSNPRVSLTVSLATTLETLQYKGDVVASRQSDEADLELVEAYRQLMLDTLGFMGEMVIGLLTGHPGLPGLVVDIEPREIFTQTPGSGAGAIAQGALI